MYAIAEIKGKQYKVEKGRYLDVDLIDLKPGSEFVIDSVLLISDGKKAAIGKPFVSGASVITEVQKNIKEEKVIVYKQRPKKRTRTKQGHRQKYTRILVKEIKGM